MKLQSLKNLRRKPLSVAIAATLLVASVAHADTESSKLKLAGFVDAAEGTELISGDYASVIKRLAPHTLAFEADAVAASTNLCVAYVAMGRLDEAHDACEAAVKIARMDQRGSTLAERVAYSDELNIAVANLAGLTKLAHE